MRFLTRTVAWLLLFFAMGVPISVVCAARGLNWPHAHMKAFGWELTTENKEDRVPMMMAAPLIAAASVWFLRLTKRTDPGREAGK